MFKWLTALLIFLIPSNLFLKFFVDSAYVHGLLSDYLIPKLYVSDLVILALLGLWVWENLPLKIKWQKINKWLVLILILFFVRQLFTGHPLASIWYFFKLVEVLALGIFFTKHPDIFKSKLIHWSLAITIAFQSLLAIYQFHTQHSLVGYYFLGEPNLSNYIGLAKGVFNGAEQTLPYGTTAHPNIVGGFIALGLIMLSTVRNKKISQGLLFLTMLVGGYALFLTQSISAWLTLLIGLSALSLQKYIHAKTIKQFLLISCLLVFILAPFVIHQLTPTPYNPSLNRRDTLNQAALLMFIDRPLIGVGLNNFTAEVEKYGNFQEVVRFVQPVHHTGLLWLSETGLLGIVLVVGLGSWLKTKSLNVATLFVLIPVLSLDHYLLTTQTGLLLTVLWLTVRAPHSPAFHPSPAARGKRPD
jgi:O-antigen ligase